MAYRVEIDNGDGGEWDSYVLSRTGASSYHRYAWKGVIEKSFGHKTYYLAARDEQGLLVGVLPLVFMNNIVFGRFFVSVPFVNYGGLLCDDKEAAAILLTEAETLLKRLGGEHVELRHLGSQFEGLATKKHKVTMILDLSEVADTQWKGFNAKLRNQIRKAEKSGLEVISGDNELLDGFYDVFARNMRDLGTPVYAKSFFKNVLDAFPDSSRVFSVVFEKKVIASGVAVWFGDRFEIPWASSIKEFKSLCPNNMLYWNAIRFAIEHGFKKFDFGRSTPGEGTFKFKEQWGAKPVQLYWQYIMLRQRPLPELNPHNPKYRLAIKVWQKLPVILTRVIGPQIVRNIP